MRRSLTAFVLLSLALVAGPAAAQTPAQTPAQPSAPAPAAPAAPQDAAGASYFMSGKGFATMDADKDGKISRQEFLAASEKRFDAMDADKDGFVTKDELKGFRQDAKERREQMKETRQKGKGEAPAQ